MLREIERWGELGPDAEDNVGCYGAAFEAVLTAIERKGWMAACPGPVTGCFQLTDTGRAELAKPACWNQR